ncbi:tRNA guanosine(34) transglycosylase Tgt [Candidatus Peregrinibacteria bacterium]|nr:tRNA guanosine(34) transglycosylase Tgt [Candidatus Peregrinibacteria bacterium]
MTKTFTFTIKKNCQETWARIGNFVTPHGLIHTPVFMPCGTKGAVKSVSPDELKTIGTEIILANTYHLMIRPGEDLIAKMGGLHKWMKWDKAILTDSGGFQIFSLNHLRHIQDEGVEFQSHLDGSKHFVTPEKCIEIQYKLGADIIMAFDECSPKNCSKQYAIKAMERTHKWAVRSLEKFKKLQKKKPSNQTLFPIIQGGMFDDLRKESAVFMSQLNTKGIAIGGLSVGEKKEKMYHILEVIEPYLPKEKPRYLMGVGSPDDIIEAVARGIDMFDCVLPTRYARHGAFFSLYQRENIKNTHFKTDKKPLIEDCECYACQNFSKSYIRHLYIENEIFAHRLLTIHNLHFLKNFMKEIQTQIKNGTFQSFRNNFKTHYKPMKGRC